jgi:hypothetical protein
MHRHFGPVAATAVTLLFPATAAAAPKFHECQHPVTTGAEVYHLRNITAAKACPTVLKLYAFDTKHENRLYGCKAGTGGGPGRPYLKRHHFHGYKLSLGGKYHYTFTMAKGSKSFRVTGTDFPVNCS